MARQQRQVEGDDTERKQRARDAKRHGQSPSEAGVTHGASKQREESKRKASHEDHVEKPRSGKRGPGTSGKPRPGNRDTDPKRTDRWE